jgi:cell division protein FtsB
VRRPPRDQLRHFVALAALLALTGFAIAGPTGLLAWGENVSALEARKAEIADLTAKRNALRNRVMLLDPQSADPDLASELVRENLGVMHEDEVVINLGAD